MKIKYIGEAASPAEMIEKLYEQYIIDQIRLAVEEQKADSDRFLAEYRVVWDWGAMGRMVLMRMRETTGEPTEGPGGGNVGHSGD